MTRQLTEQTIGIDYRTDNRRRIAGTEHRRKEAEEMALPLFRHSIVKRWTVGVLSIVTLTVFAAAVALCFFIRV